MTHTLQAESYALPTRHQLPRNVVDWRVEPHRAVLLVHDMQSYFLGAFDPGLRAQLVGNVATLRRRGAHLGVRTAYTAQPGRMTQRERGLLRDFWGPGMTSSDTDRSVVEELRPGERDWTFVKWRYSAFFRSDLLARMRAEGRDQLMLCGVFGHVGILATALEAYSHDLQVFLVADAVGDFSEAKHRLTMEYTAGCCAMVTTVDQVLA